MTDPNRIAGALELTYNGKVIKCASTNVSYNIGKPIREEKLGPDSVHGYSELPQTPYIEGEARLVSEFSLSDLLDATEVTVVLTMATGKIFMLSDAWFTGEGTAGTEEGSVPFKFCGLKGEVIG